MSVAPLVQKEIATSSSCSQLVVVICQCSHDAFESSSLMLVHSPLSLPGRRFAHGRACFGFRHRHRSASMPEASEWWEHVGRLGAFELSHAGASWMPVGIATHELEAKPSGSLCSRRGLPREGSLLAIGNLLRYHSRTSCPSKLPWQPWRMTMAMVVKQAKVLSTMQSKTMAMAKPTITSQR